MWKTIGVSVLHFKKEIVHMVQDVDLNMFQKEDQVEMVVEEEEVDLEMEEENGQKVNLEEEIDLEVNQRKNVLEADQGKRVEVEIGDHFV